MANTWGRPTTYKESFIDEAQSYLDKCKDDLDVIMEKEINTEKDIGWVMMNEKKVTKIWVNNVKLPSIEWLAKHINVSRSNIYKWRDEHPEFSDILEKILEEQAERLINMWLAWRYNWTITKLLLAKHWYIEKQEVDSKNTWISEDAKADVYKKLSEKIDEMKPDEVNTALNDLLN